MAALHRFLKICALAFLAFPLRAGAEPPLQKQSESYFDLPLRSSITVENPAGSIHIYGWYEPRVRLSALSSAYSPQRLAQVGTETKAGGDSLVVRAVIPPVHGFFADRSGKIDYSLNVPENAHLTLRLGDGEISLQGLRGGEAVVSLTNGRVTAMDCFAQVRARTLHGVMEVFFGWWENAPATFDYQLGEGRIGALLPAVAQFRVEATTAQGRIGNGFEIKGEPPTGSSQTLNGATDSQAPLLLRFRSGGGNISIDRAP